MGGPHERVLTGLKTAIEAEIEGHHFYRMAMSSTPDEKGQGIFDQLAREEMEHARFLKAQYDAIEASGKPDVALKLGKPVNLSGGSPIFSDQLKGRIKEAHFEITALSVGVQLELNAIQFYKGEAAASDDEVVTSFYEELASWESGHYQALLRQLEELKGDFWAAGGFSPF